MPVTFADKDNTLPTSDPRRLVRDVDLNEIKATVNANETTMTSGLSARPLSTSFVYKETPAGLINSSNTVYTLANTPIAGSEHVYLNGQLMEDGGTDYNISGATITFLIAPTTGDKLKVTYRK